MSTVDKSKAPYFDDADEDKQYYEMLFRPKKAVQVRELNQLQSMFYTQIKRFGNHIFEDGSRVLNGETNYDLELQYVTLTIADYSSVVAYLGSSSITLESSNGVTANAKIFTAPVDADPSTYHIEYNSGSTDGGTTLFTVGETIDIKLNGATITTAEVLAVGQGSKFTINSGIYYINGRFVLVDGQTVILEKYSNTPSKIVCLVYNESITTEDADDSLFDNAQGSPNFTAPGAHRLKVDVTATVYDLADLDALPENAVEIFRIDSGDLQLKYSGPQYNVLDEVLAQRTYEESGNYTVKSWNINFDDHDSDSSKFVVELDPGIGYINGRRIETLSKTEIDVDKARESESITNAVISADIGYYLVGDFEVGSLFPDITILPSATMYDITYPASGSELGTCRVRFVSTDPDNIQMYLYLFDVKDTTGKRTTEFIQNVAKVISTEGSGFEFTGPTGQFIQEASKNSVIYPIGLNNVYSLTADTGFSNTLFTYNKRVTGTFNGSGELTFSAGANETFLTQTNQYSVPQYTDGALEVYNIETNVPVNTGATITLTGGGVGRSVALYLQVVKSRGTQKVKTVQSTTVVFADTDWDTDRLPLDKADVYEITSVIDDNSDDITANTTLYENKTKSFYDISYLTGLDPLQVTYPLSITFKYFAHSAGDYFGADSYSSIDYDDIPIEDSVRLSDVLDFRPRIANSGTDFTSTGGVVGYVPSPDTIITAYAEYYLPRYDKVYVNSNGEFAVVQGVSSLDPKLPNDPANSMTLYTLDVPAYTFDLGNIKAKKIKNRRYTMHDIGLLENRLSNVEYYASLNLLELEAEAKQTIDPDTGLNRFKNGFLTDSFVDHSVGDYTLSNYRVSISNNGELRPEFSLNAVDLEIDEASSTNVVINDGIVTLPYAETSFIKQDLRSEAINVNPYAIYRWAGSVNLVPSIDSWLDTEYVDPSVTYNLYNNGELSQSWNSWELNWVGGSITNSEVTTTQTGTVTGGINLTVDTLNITKTTTNIEEKSDKLVDSSVVPYMRSIDIVITGVGNRPSSKMYFFFDETDVNSYVKPEFGSYGDDVITDSLGGFTATFTIPNTESAKFRTGERVLAISDRSDNNRQLSTSYAETIFTSTGIRQIKQKTIVATRNVDRSTSVSARYIDPIAQSFLVEQTGGAFITKINTFFKSKDSNIPVTLELREMENGLPTNRIVPGGKKTLSPADINVSDDGSIATAFEFGHPIYLSSNNEYCFVVMANSNKYELFIGVLGKQDLGTEKYIAEQPYAGVMFKSQNNSSWSEDQTADVQFEIFRAEFNTGVVGNLVMTNKNLDPILLSPNKIQTVSGSDTVTIYKKRHNYLPDARVLISGATAGNGITEGALNKEHSIQNVIDFDYFTIQLSGSLATATGSIGGTACYISNMIQATSLYPNIPTIELANTSVDFTAKCTTGQSIDGTETKYQATSVFNISNNDNNELQYPYMITNQYDELFNLSGSKSLFVYGSMQSSLSNISPVVDLYGINVITPCILINDSSVTADADDNWANYITEPASLRLSANILKVFLDINNFGTGTVYVSARIANTLDELEEADWELLTNSVTQTATSRTEFFENEFDLSAADEFTQYQIMIQFKSDNQAVYPKCKKLRAIALYS